MEDPSCLQPLSVKNLSPSVQSCLRRLDFREETILESLDDGNAEFDHTRAHAYGGVDHANGGVDFFVIRTDVELLFGKENDEGKERREPAKPLAGKGGRVKPGRCLNNAHHDMPLCTIQEADGSKPARTRASFTKTYKMDALQVAQCGRMVLYRKVPFKQKRLWLSVDSPVSQHGTCHSLKNDANDGEHADWIKLTS